MLYMSSYVFPVFRYHSRLITPAAVMIAELLEGKRLKLVHSEFTCTFILTGNRFVLLERYINRFFSELRKTHFVLIMASGTSFDKEPLKRSRSTLHDQN